MVLVPGYRPGSDAWAGSAGRERLGFPWRTQRGDHRCYVQVLVGIHMVVCLPIATGWMAIAGPAWALTTVTVPW